MKFITLNSLNKNLKIFFRNIISPKIEEAKETAVGALALAEQANELASEEKLIVVKGTDIDEIEFVQDETYDDYPYKASIRVSKVTENFSPDVRFGPQDAMSGNLAPFADTVDGYVNIYSKTDDGLIEQNLLAIILTKSI